MTLDAANDAEAGPVGKLLHRRELAELAARGSRDRLGDRVLARGLDGAGQPEDVCARGAVQRHDVDQFHLALGDGAGLVEHDRGDPPRLLEDLRALDQDPELRAAPGADQKTGRRRESERARAGDDQHRDGGRERSREVARREQPAGERGERDRDHDRHEHGGDAVDEALDRRLSRLGLGDQPCDLRQRGLGPHLRRAHDQPPVRVDRRSRDLDTGLDLHRDGLARQHRLVDRRGALLDDAVGRDLLAGTDEEAVADAELLDGHQHLLAVSEHARLLRSQLEQYANRRARAAAGARFKEAAEQDQRRGHGADLEIHVLAREGGDDGRRPRPRCQRPDRDQRVHRRRPVSQVERCGAVEGPAGPEHDRRRQPQRKPLPARELKLRHQLQQRQRHGQHGGADEPAPQHAQSIVRLARLRDVGGRPRQRGAVADRLDRPDQPLELDSRGIELDRSLLGRIVDARLDAVELVQLPLDSRRAGGAGHPLDLEADAFGGRGRVHQAGIGSAS